MNNNTLRISEVFYSLQGETRTLGLPTVFVRLTGCPLRCNYCDTEYAFHGGDIQTFEQLHQQVASFQPKYICVTGGEPLAQPNCKSFLAELCQAGYEVSLETSGSIDISYIDPRVSVVLDLKTPNSGESSKNLYDNIPLLMQNDQVKFVICSREDYDWARFKIDELKLTTRVDDIIFSPSFNEIDASQLADWIIQDNLPVRFQLQLHKLLWNDEPGH